MEYNLLPDEAPYTLNSIRSKNKPLAVFDILMIKIIEVTGKKVYKKKKKQIM